jgi:hypothetical protein
MKKIILTAAIIILAFVFTAETKAEYRHGGYGYFYTSLAPHGSWMELDGGLVVWRPALVRRGWAPYTAGQWIWTSDGWYWDSYEDFGYITYHYGRWFYDDFYGWLWVPDNEWAPSWVEWRYDNDYIGWAPLSPYALFSVNVGIHFSVEYNTPYSHWHFVRYRHFCDPYVNKYYVSDNYNRRIYSNTRYRTNYGYERDRVVNRGVDIDIVRSRSGRNISERSIERVSDPGSLRNSTGRNSNDRVRAFVATDEQIGRDAGKVEIKRSDRKTSLETSRVEIGRPNANSRTSTRDIEKPNNSRNNPERSAENVRPGGNERSSESIRTQNQGRATENIRNRESNSRPQERKQQAEPNNEGAGTERKASPERNQSFRIGNSDVKVQNAPSGRNPSVNNDRNNNPSGGQNAGRPAGRTQQPERKAEKQENRSSSPARSDRQSSGSRNNSGERQNQRSDDNNSDSRGGGRTR